MNKFIEKIQGTCYQGEIKTSYKKLIETLGEANLNVEDLDGKSRKMWVIDTKSGVATIYDWKNFDPLDEVDIWNIGGNNKSVVKDVKDMLK